MMMTGREAKRLALLSIIGATEIELGTADEDLYHPETRLRLTPDHAHAIRREAEKLCETMKQRASRLRSFGQIT